MPSPNKLFIYVDQKTSAVLHTKESRKFDFFFESDEIETHLLVSKGRTPLPSYQVSFTPFGGCTPIQLDAEARVRCELSKARIEAYIYLSTLAYMIIEEIHTSFSAENLATADLNAEALRAYVKLSNEEKELTVAIVQRFIDTVKSDLTHANSLEKIAAITYHIQHNVNLGVYSATNQERKRIDFRK